MVPFLTRSIFFVKDKYQLQIAFLGRDSNPRRFTSPRFTSSMVSSSMIQFLNGYILGDSLHRWFLPSRIHFLYDYKSRRFISSMVHFFDGIFYQLDEINHISLKNAYQKFFRPKFQTPLATITNHDNFFLNC